MSKNNQDRDAIATRAMGIASAQERGAYIADACGDDAELKRTVEEQVAARSAGRDEHAAPADDTSSTNQRSRPAGAKHGETRDFPLTGVGPYKVLKQTGESAAELVFQAEQQEPVPLKVAIKVVKDGLDWAPIVARFEAEREILARLDHPSIAKILGVGTRQSGRPYFVMEWVEGLPITRYCDEHQMPLRKRLELFISVCRAVQYAHQKGVIHGNLQPSNVLVSGSNDKPTPKVLDFGVAQAMRPRSSDGGSADSESLGGALEYLSPDQAGANARDMDTRDDVYSLGALLYELVTGTTPLPRERLKSVSRTEALRLIREEEIPSPSERLHQSGDRLESIAAKRDLKPAALVKEVRGDLDCLVLKAIQKDRNRRYESAGDLGQDVQRFLDLEPPEACPSGTKQQLRKVARQHPRAVTVAVIGALLALAIGAAGASVAAWAWHGKGQAEQAEKEATDKQKKAEKDATETRAKHHMAEAERKATAKERDQAREAARSAERSEDDTRAILAFLKDRLLSAGRPEGGSLPAEFWAKGLNKDVTLRKAVDAAETRIHEEFADRPLAEATVREMLGSAYLDLGDATQAVKQYELALGLREARQGDGSSEAADCRNKLAVAYRLANRPADAARLFDRSTDSAAHASALDVRASMLLMEKKPAEAELKLRQALKIRQKIGPDDWRTFSTQTLLGEALLQQKKYADAEPLLLSGYEGLKKHKDDLPAGEKGRLTRALERLEQLYEAWGKKAEAEKWRKEREANGTTDK